MSAWHDLAHSFGTMAKTSESPRASKTLKRFATRKILNNNNVSKTASQAYAEIFFIYAGCPTTPNRYATHPHSQAQDAKQPFPFRLPIDGKRVGRRLATEEARRRKRAAPKAGTRVENPERSEGLRNAAAGLGRIGDCNHVGTARPRPRPHLYI